MQNVSEEDLTKMAILRSKADDAAAKARAIIEDENPKPKTPEEPKNPKEPESTTNPETGEDLSKYKYSIKLGNDKIAYFTNWTGRTKKVFSKMLSELTPEADEFEDELINNILTSLIRDYLRDPDMYLSDTEQQYLLTKIREISLSDDVEFNSICPECGDQHEISAKIDEVYHYTPGVYPIQNKDMKLTYVDIVSDEILKNTIKEIMESPNFDNLTSEADIEIALHLDKDNMNAIQILEMIDDMGLKDLAGLLKGLREAAPKLEMYYEDVCKNSKCRKKVKFLAPDIPDVFSELM